MFKRTHLMAVTIIALGGLLGYAAASSHLTSLWQAHAAPPSGESCPTAGCCSDNLNMAELLAKADGLQPSQQGQPPKDGTKLRLQKIYNLYQDPFERADITSNTFWDWQLNHVGKDYGVMDDIMKFSATFKEYPPRSIPPSFNPATIMEETLDSIRRARKKAVETPKPLE